MLQAIDDLPEEERTDYVMRYIIAVDTQTRAELHITRGYSKRGNTERYFVTIPNGRKIEMHFKSGPALIDSTDRLFGLRASSDEEAIEKANKMFPKKYEKYQREQRRTG